MHARRLTGSLACLVVLTLTAAGCGLSGGSDDGDATAGGCKVDKGNVGSGKLTGDVKGKITFQTTNLKKDFGGFFNGVIKDFEKANPGTSVKWIDDPGDSTFTQRTVADAQGCTMPDVINIDAPTATALTKAGYLLDVGVKDPDAAKPFVPAFWKSSTYKDASGTAAHTVLPWYTGGVLLTYNTDMLKKAGIDPAKPPKTMFGLFADYEKIAKSAKGKYFATMANPIWRIPADWDQMDIRTLSADGKSAVFADDPRTAQWVAWMAKLYKGGAMPKDSLSSSNDPSTPYSQGQVAYGSTNPSFVRFVKQNSPSVYAKTGVGQQPFSNRRHPPPPPPTPIPPPPPPPPPSPPLSLPFPSFRNLGHTRPIASLPSPPPPPPPHPPPRRAAGRRRSWRTPTVSASRNGRSSGSRTVRDLALAVRVEGSLLEDSESFGMAPPLYSFAIQATHWAVLGSLAKTADCRRR